MCEVEQEENIYEGGDFRYENQPSVVFRKNALPAIPVREPSYDCSRSNAGGDAQKHDNASKEASASTKKWILAGIGVGFLIIIMQVVVIVMLAIDQTKNASIEEARGADVNNKTKSASIEEARGTDVDNKTNCASIEVARGTDVDNKTNSQTETTIKSCYDLKLNEPMKSSGIYNITPDEKFQGIDVYCDMETDGGGWTLVASIHEDEINYKCNGRDRWAVYTPESSAGYIGESNWENKNIFGSLQTVITDDYKNRAYYSLNSRDVMVWHVPSSASMATMKYRATLRYRTENQFLQNFGGNLKTMFQESLPLKWKPGSQDTVAEERTRKTINALIARSDSIKALIFRWHTYGYIDGQQDRITGNDTYDSYGNKITFRGRSFYTSINYGTSQKAQNQLYVESRKSEPFMLVAVVGGEGGTMDYFQISITSYRDIIRKRELENNITMGGFELQYRAVEHLNSARNLAICEYVFIVFNEVDWRSRPPTSFRRTSTLYTWSHWISNSFIVEGSPRNFVMGYLLLTSSSSFTFTTGTLDSVSDLILRTISGLKDLFNEDINAEGSFFDVTFDHGSANEVLQMQPPEMQQFVEPGYIHFRPFNIHGYPNALCPGIKTKSHMPEYVCIGGLSADIESQFGTCGDLAGWAGRTDDEVTDYPSGYAHSRSDISSTILIFYR